VELLMISRHDFNDEEDFGSRGFTTKLKDPEETTLMTMWTEYARELIGKSFFLTRISCPYPAFV
jgi:hypothetical protein